MTTRVLFICLGNICRSPSAEGVFRDFAKGLDVEIDSAGTGNWHVGNPPYGLMQQACEARGYDISDLRARQFTAADFDAFDLIIGMDGEIIADMEELRPKGNDIPIKLFTDYAPSSGANFVPDPYYTGGYDEALDLIEEASRGLAESIAGIA